MTTDLDRDLRGMFLRHEADLVGRGTLPPDIVGRVRRRQTRTAFTAFVAAIAGVVVAISVVSAIESLDRTQTPAIQPTQTPAIRPTPPASAVGRIPETDYLLDLNTGEMTPLPRSIVGTEIDGYAVTGNYAASPDGSRLAFAAPGDNGKSQIFVANLDGSGVEQVTRAGRATSPAWSPDGSRIAYRSVAPGDDLSNVFILDLATGSSTQLTFHGWPTGVSSGPSFSPDGSLIVYGVHDEDGFPCCEVRKVPTIGGENVPLVRPGAGNPHFLQDGSLSYTCGPNICLANADGTDRRVIVHGGAGARWSPDGIRIAYGGFPSFELLVLDLATRERTQVATGRGAVWLDDHTLIVERTGCPGSHERYEKCFG